MNASAKAGWCTAGVVVLILLFCILFGGPSKGENNIQNTTSLIKIEEYEDLYYDPRTQNVYILFNERSGYAGYGYMSAYFADNGKPYKFDLSLRELVEIP